MGFNDQTGKSKSDIPAVIITGKRKPSLKVSGNEEKINRFKKSYYDMVKKLKDDSFPKSK